MAALAAGVGLSAVGGLYAGYQQKKATDSANAATRAQVALATKQVKKHEKKAGALYTAGKKDLEAGYQEANKQTSVLGAAARRRLARRETKMQGSADAHAMNRGLGGSSTNRGFNRAVKTDTDLGIAQINESVAAARAGIARERGQALYTANAQYAQQMGQFAGMLSGVTMAPTHQAGNMSGIGMGLSSIGQMLGLYSGLRGGAGTPSNNPFPGAMP